MCYISEVGKGKANGRTLAGALGAAAPMPSLEEGETLHVAASSFAVEPTDSKLAKNLRFAPVGATLNLPELEHSVLDLWEKEDAFGVLRKKNAGNERFSFYDGPITANVEAMGVHHAWSRTYKDINQRYQAMLGKDQRYQNGFDCQGLWVEVQVERELNLNSKRDIESYGLDKFSDACRARVDRSAAAITAQSKRLGQWMDWDNSYFTYSDSNISHIWNVLKICQERGWLYKGHRSMPWCARCGTSLAQHEMADSHREVTHTSIYAKLPLEGTPNEFFLVWTTTPWTLPANVALAVNSQLDYVKATVNGQTLILGKKAFEAMSLPDATVESTLKGSDLVGLRYTGPFDDLSAAQDAKDAHRVIAWKEVSEDEGTGIVHIAPGCGGEDFALSKTENLPVIVPIDEAANFVAGYDWLTGKATRDVAALVAEDLDKRGFLFKAMPYKHLYPVCWRCKEEIVFRVDDSWFIAMDAIRPQMLAAAQSVNWLPEAAGVRMQNWLTNMGDWNISRKRYWGLPLPFYNCTNGHLFVIGSEEELRTRAISGLEQLRDLHRPWIDNVVVACPQCLSEGTRVKEVGDCWLDAGVVPFSTLDWLHDRSNWDKWFPADYVVEMGEQVRLWFYSALFFSTVLTNQAPYKTNASHAKVLASKGQEFHKTGANMLDLGQTCDELGADVVRWLYARQNVQENLYWGKAPVSDIKRRMLTLWNTYSFFVTYANLDNFDPNAPEVLVKDRQLIDRWLLSTLANLTQECTAALEAHDTAAAVYKLEAFWEDLSTWYVRRNRKRFWQTSANTDSLAAYQTLYTALTTLVRLLAPIMPFLSEAMYQNLVRGKQANSEASVHHTAYPVVNTAWLDDDLEKRMRTAMRVVSLGRAARANAGVKTRTPMAKLIAVFDENDRDFGVLANDDALSSVICEELNIKSFEIRAQHTGLVNEVVKPALKVLGPKLGSDLPRVQAAFASGKFKSVAGGVEVEGFTLSSEEVLVSKEGTIGHSVSTDAGVVVALETTLTPELEAEGLARELVRCVNELRKTAGMDISDRIALRYEGAIAPAIELFADFVKGETLSTSLVAGLTGSGHAWSGDLNGLATKLEIEKV